MGKQIGNDTPISTYWQAPYTAINRTGNILDLYGDPKRDWSNYQIHHIQPRTYGGTNDVSNLIPIPSTQHALITSWFNGY